MVFFLTQTVLPYSASCTKAFTFNAKWSIIGSSGAVTGVAIVFLNTLPAVGAVHPIARAVARAAGLHPWRDFCPLFQVQCHSIHP